MRRTLPAQTHLFYVRADVWKGEPTKADKRAVTSPPRAEYERIRFCANPTVNSGSVAMSETSGFDFSEFLRNGKVILDIFRGLRDLLPKGPDADKAQEQIERAEQALATSEAELAKALGYHLCQCTFPPQIMLSKGRHAVHDEEEIFRCPKCENQEPPEARFRALDQMKAGGQGGSRSWTGARRGR